MSKHTIIGDHEVIYLDAGNNEAVAYPTFQIAYSFTEGSGPTGPSYASGGEPGYPAEAEIISVKLVDGDGIEPTHDQLDAWAEEWLESDQGYSIACSNARDNEQCARDDARQNRYAAMRETRED
ncbi:MAG: hypothetical protein ACP5QR_05060 [Rhizomicrobium sp.]